MKKVSFPLNKGFTILGFTAILLCTYFRENILLEINALIDLKGEDRSFSYWFINFFKSIPVTQLNYWKWGVTFFFSALIPIITIISLHSWFQDEAYRKILVLVYIICFSFLILIGVVGILFNCFDLIYFLLRKVLGVVQSPFPFFCFFLLFYNKKINLS
jgi:hypothetical protein